MSKYKTNNLGWSNYICCFSRAPMSRLHARYRKKSTQPVIINLYPTKPLELHFFYFCIGGFRQYSCLNSTKCVYFMGAAITCTLRSSIAHPAGWYTWDKCGPVKCFVLRSYQVAFSLLKLISDTSKSANF